MTVRFTPHSARANGGPRPEKGRFGRLPAEETAAHGAPRKGSHGPACADPAARALLLPYALSRCTDDESFDFEVHVLCCAACFRDLKRLDLAGSLLHELMDAPSPALNRVRQALRDEPPHSGKAPRGRSAS